MRFSTVFCVLVSLHWFVSTTVLADADAAKGYVKEAEDLIEKGSTYDLRDARQKLELAETELDGVAEAAKSPVAAAIKAAKAKIAEKQLAFDKPKFKRKLDRAMSEAEGSIGNLATWGTAERLFNEVFNDPEAKAVLGAELDAAAKKFATFKKLNTKKSAVQYVAQLTSQVEYLENQWKEKRPEIDGPNASPNGKDDAIDRMTRNIADCRKRITDQLGADDENAKALFERVDKIADEFTKIALSGRVKEVLETLKRKIDLYKNDWDGYEQETAGPVWADYRSKQSEKMSRFLAPKTIVYIQRTSSFLESLEKDADYQSVKTDKAVKAIVDDAIAKRDAAATKIAGFVTALVEGAEKAPDKDADNFDRLHDDVRFALGENTPLGSTLLARMKKKIDDHVAATTGAEEAKVNLIKKLRAKAEEAWPKLYDGMTWTVEIDLSHPERLKGKNIGFLSDNLMGYRFKPGDFYFATTIGGIPCAAKFDAQLMTQIKATEKAIGRALGDDDGDGKWDIIAVVTDKKGKLMAKREAEGTGKVGGVDVKVKTEYAEPVDAVIIEIIAAKCGPFAGAKDRGVLKEDGTVAK